MPPGGRRPGAGRKKGYRAPQTIQRQIDKEQLRQRALAIVAPRFDAMIEAQIEHALGVSYMVLRDKSGSYVKLSEDPDVAKKQINAGIAAGGEAIKFFKQAPNAMAFSGLWDRTLDKPIERQEVTGKDGTPLEVIVKKPW